MLTGLQLSSFACKCVFYRPEHNARGDPMELNFGDLDRAQRLNEKNWFICHVILFTPRVMVIKMSIMAQFFVFAAHGSKMPVTFWTKYLLF